MNSADQSVVRREMVVDAPIAHPFATFVDRFGDFKPPGHNLLGAPITKTTFESHVGWAHLRRRRRRERVPLGPDPRFGGIHLAGPDGR